VIDFLKKSAFLLFCGIAYSCATPTTPTGGPPDRQGPKIIGTNPETGTIEFKDNSFEFRFSEFVDRSSMRPAITVEPDIGIDYALDWGRKSVTMEFENELPEFTTLIVSIGTDLKDMRGNKMSAPVKIAVSTGPEIDEGEMMGRIINAKTGKGSGSQRILLYRSPVDLSQKADYLAETDTSGRFRFSYLRQGTYKAFWADDRNRDKIWNRERERAQPFSEEFKELEKADIDTLGNIYITTPDTTKPVLQGVGLFSDRRLRLRFSENITISNNTSIELTDTLDNKYSGAYPLYVSPAEPYVLFAQSEKQLNPEQAYKLNINALADESGNFLKKQDIVFSGSAQKDTTRQRIIKDDHEPGLFPDESLEIVYAAPISDPAIRDSVKVVAGTELVEPWPHLSISRNRLKVLPDGRWRAGVNYEVRIWDTIRNRSRNMELNLWDENSLGILNVELQDTTNAEQVRLSVISEEGETVADTSFVKSVEILDLPEAEYRVIAYKDLNRNGIWEFGGVDPFRAPEPYFIRNEVPVKGSFTADLTISFKN